MLTMALIFTVQTQARANTIVLSAPEGEWDLYDIMDELYGDNYTRVPDTNDMFWFETDGGVNAIALYAAADQQLGYLAVGTETNVLIGPELTENIVPPNSTSLGTFQVTNGGPFVFLNAANGYPGVETFYSDPALNSDGQDHMVTFRVTNLLNTYVIAFEDLPIGNPLTRGGSSVTGDQDYNDLVVQVTNAAPVPEPGTMFLLAVGSLGLAVTLRKRLNR
jgi:hypothetical protein